MRVGPWVFVAGTAAVGRDGSVQPAGDASGQTRVILSKIEEALKSAGATMDDVVRTVLYVTDIGDWEAIGRVHGEFFGNVRPASTMVQVSRLVDPEMIVEIEATAYVEEVQG